MVESFLAQKAAETPSASPAKPAEAAIAAAEAVLTQPETPPAVVLNEALELARQYSTVDAVRFVNGVLDSIRRGIAGPDSPVS